MAAPLGDVAWIDTTAALDDWMGALADGPLAVDTEADSFHHYREKVCLVQLTSGNRHALVDPLAGVDLEALRIPLADANQRKILHGADYDVRLLQRDFDLTIRNLYDTSIAARLTGEAGTGLAALLEKYLGVTLDKSHQRADWSLRPMSAPMRDYASADTRHLEALADILDANAQRLGRAAWVQEECQRTETVRWRDRRQEEAEPFRRVKGIDALDRAGLAVLREAWTWREELASQRDRPVFRVLRDESLIALVQARPATTDGLAKIPGLADGLRRGSHAQALLAAVHRGIACAEAQWPALRVDTRVRLEPTVATRLDAIKTKRDGVARELGLDATLIASRAVMEDMANRDVAGDDPCAAPELRGWQRELLGPLLAVG